jgi:hypothetical protein
VQMKRERHDRVVPQRRILMLGGIDAEKLKEIEPYD